MVRSGAAPDVPAVEVDVGGDPPGRRRRVREVEEPRSPCSSAATDSEEHRPPRRLRESFHGLGDGQDAGAAGGIVVGAVVDLLAGLGGLAEPRWS